MKIFVILGALLFSLSTHAFAVKYITIQPSETGVYAAKKVTGWGFVTKKGELTSFDFEKILAFNRGGFGAGKKNGRFYIYNKDGKILSVVQDVDALFQGDDEVWVYRSLKKYGAINVVSGKKFADTYEFMTGFSGGFSWVKKAGKYGLINQKGEMVLPAKYDGVHEFGVVNGESVVFCKTRSDELVAVLVDLRSRVLVGGGCN